MSFLRLYLSSRKNISAFLFRIHNTITLSRHEWCLMRLRFEKNFSHQRSFIKHTCSWCDKLIVIYISFPLGSLHCHPYSPHFLHFHTDSPHYHADSPYPHSSHSRPILHISLIPFPNFSFWLLQIASSVCIN